MNLNQAKKAAGIAPHETIAGREALEAAMCRCVAGIVEARRKGNDTRAAELSEAKEVFRRRIRRNTCPVCGVVIGNGSTHCQVHQRAAAKALPPTGPETKPEPKGNSNARTPVAPVGGALAHLGFYTAPVKAVVAKWQPTLGAAMVKRYFTPLAMAVVFRNNHVELPFVGHQHWQAVFELGAAIASVMNDTSKPQAWLLSLADCATNGRYKSWQEIRDDIAKQGGPTFTTEQLAQADKRMGLATPREMAKAFRHDMKAA